MICLRIKIIVRLLRYTHFFVYFPFRTASTENTKYRNHKLRRNCCSFVFCERQVLKLIRAKYGTHNSSWNQNNCYFLQFKWLSQITRTCAAEMHLVFDCMHFAFFLFSAFALKNISGIFLQVNMRDRQKPPEATFYRTSVFSPTSIKNAYLSIRACVFQLECLKSMK